MLLCSCQRRQNRLLCPDTYVTSFLSEEDTIPYPEICKIGNEITVVNRTEDGIKQLHYVKDNGNGSAEYFGYELPYGKTSYEKTELKRRKKAFSSAFTLQSRFF